MKHPRVRASAIRAKTYRHPWIPKERCQLCGHFAEQDYRRTTYGFIRYKCRKCNTHWQYTALRAKQILQDLEQEIEESQPKG